MNKIFQAAQQAHCNPPQVPGSPARRDFLSIDGAKAPAISFPYAVTTFFLSRSHSSFLDPLEINQLTRRTLKHENSSAMIHSARSKRPQVVPPNCYDVPENVQAA